MKLIYESDFSDPGMISDWTLEGPGTIEIKDGKLIMTPYAQRAVYEKWESHNRKPLDPYNELYYPVIKNEIAKSKVYPFLDKLSGGGGFNGGHIVAWNKAFETGDSYIVEYDFKPLSPVGLGIVFFSAAGVDGQDVLSKELAGRYGVFSSYTKGDINCYHISYWANNASVGKRGTCNLRKNSGFFNLANGIDPSVKELDYASEKFTFRKHRIRLEKINDRIAFYVDGELAIECNDQKVNDILDADGNLKEKNVDTGDALGGGRIGLRQMVGLKAEYSNFKVFAAEGNK